MHDSTEPILFITGNTGKVEEVKRFLGLPVEHIALNLPEIQSLNSEDIVRVKAEFAFAQLGRPVLVEDVSLTFSAMGALPGPFIKYFLSEIGVDELCHLVDGKDRSCVASVTYGYHDGTEVHFFTGEMPGTVSENPRGERSFGWASIVIPQGQYDEVTHQFETKNHLEQRDDKDEEDKTTAEKQDDAKKNEDKIVKTEKTYAEMTDEEQEHVAMRKQALMKLRQFLDR
jgi:non-canonical purine NTP pyrophosphatase (RdgB/HAM1 family)